LQQFSLFSFKTVATGAAFRIATARIAYVDFTKGAIIACAIIFAFRHAATDTGIHFLTAFVHHNNFLLVFDTKSMRNLSKDY
jgi:hypothetical protein